MTVYSLVSSLLSYVFTTIIYLFIFSVIGLIYMDIKKMNKGESAAASEESEYDDDEAADGGDYEHTALLRTVRSPEAAEAGMKKAYRIGEEPTVVGRGKQCDIVISDMFLSVEHFQIWYEDGVWYIGDMGSRNGTLLNDVRLKKVQPLSDGDEISFGGLKVVFEEEN